jgi:hypothetical protein
MADAGHVKTSCLECPNGQFSNATGVSGCQHCENDICWSDKVGAPATLTVLGQLSDGFVLTILDWTPLTNYDGVS